MNTTRTRSWFQYTDHSSARRFLIIAALLLISLLTATPLHAQQAPLANAPAPPLTGAVSISAGDGHTCALLQSGALRCWGWGGFGQIGDGYTLNRMLPSMVSGASSGTAAVTAGDGHTCIVTTAGAVRCFGASFAPMPQTMPGLQSGMRQVRTGRAHFCAVNSGVGVMCWGANDNGQLGNGSTVPSNEPVAVKGITFEVKQIALGGWHTCALTVTGQVYCWGSNGMGQLGDRDLGDYRTTPTAVAGLNEPLTSIAAGPTFTCGTTNVGGVICWGGYWLGPTAASVDYGEPAPVPGLSSGVTFMDAGESHACALMETGGVKCWGNNEFGQLGVGTKEVVTGTVDVPGLQSDVVSVSAGRRHTCAVVADGSAFCWGEGSAGALGSGLEADQPSPGAVRINGGYFLPFVREPAAAE